MGSPKSDKQKEERSLEEDLKQMNLENQKLSHKLEKMSEQAKLKEDLLNKQIQMLKNDLVGYRSQDMNEINKYKQKIHEEKDF